MAESYENLEIGELSKMSPPTRTIGIKKRKNPPHPTKKN
jgi:hypothetical protein